MGGVLSAGDIEDVAVETLRAGADMFLVCHNQELVWRGYEAVLRMAERDRKFAAQVERSAKRVLSFKRRSRELRGFSAEPGVRVVEKLRKLLTDFTRIAGGEVIDDRLHTTKEINV
jgi:beta-glucosidase-like glycosyl hydrolase